MDSTVNPKVKIAEREGVGVRPLVRNTSKVKGCVGAPGWIKKIDKQVDYSHEPTQTKQQVG